MYVVVLSFENVTFALTTPKTIRGCVVVDLSYPQFFPCKRMHWSLTVNLIASIKVQLRVFSLKFVLIEATSTCSNGNLIKYGLSTSQVGSLCSFQLYLIIGRLYKGIVFALYLWSNFPYFGVKLVPFIVWAMNNHLDIS